MNAPASCLDLFLVPECPSDGLSVVDETGGLVELLQLAWQSRPATGARIPGAVLPPP